MNNGLKNKVRSLQRLLYFLLYSGNHHRIHSPFLYAFIGDVIRKDRAVEGGDKIEQIRHECFKSSEIVNKTDYGTGGKNPRGMNYPVALSQIAKTSLTSPRYARRLYHLVINMKASTMLEIGSSLGFTTAYLALANPNARIITLEGCPELCRKAREHYNRIGISNIEVMEGRFEETLPVALEKLGTVDLIYLDGNHHKESMLKYYEQCQTHINTKTVMVLDDIHASKGMEEAWDLIRARQEVRISLDLFYTGWLFYRKESSRQHFRLRYL